MATIRSVAVEPPSASREGFAVLRGAFHIVFWSALVILLERGGTRAAAPGAADAAPGRAVGPDPAQLTVDQRAFQDLGTDEQRIFLQVQEGLLEAENLRSASGAWPSAEALAQDGVPPFTRDPLDKVGFTWRALISGRTVNYLGQAPVGSDRMSFVLLILEPEPGVPDDPTQPLDQFHHRLADGTLLHVSTWVGPASSAPTTPTARLPVEQGWRQIVTQ